MIRFLSPHILRSLEPTSQMRGRGGQSDESSAGARGDASDGTDKLIDVAEEQLSEQRELNEQTAKLASTRPIVWLLNYRRCFFW